MNESNMTPNSRRILLPIGNSNLTIAIGGVLILAIAIAFVLVPSQPVKAQQAPVRIGVIDVQKVLAESVAGRQAQAAIDATQERRRAELEPLQNEATTLKANIDEGQLSMSEEALAERRGRLERLLIDLKRQQDDANREIRKEGEARLAALEGALMPEIDAMGRAGGYTLLLNKYQSGLLFAADGADITDEVIRRFDAITAAQ